MVKVSARPMGFLAALTSGLATALAFPHWGLWPLAWVGLIPLFWVLETRSPKEGAIVGWASGMVHFAIILYWLVDTMQVYGRIPLLASVAVMVLLVVYLAGFWALFGWAICLGKLWGIPPFISGPFVWVCTEALRGYLFSGFPWALMGYSQWQVRPIIQVADLVGVFGLSFILVMVNGSLTFLLLSFKSRDRAWGVLMVSLTGAIVGGALVYGDQRIEEVETLWMHTPKMKVGIVQGNVPQSMKWEPTFQEATLDTYLKGTRKLVEAEGARIVVWPETSVPFFFQREGPLRDRLIQEVATMGVEVLFGAPAHGIEDERRVFYNRAYLLGRSGELLGHYDKTHLVPFGEYLPLQGMVPFLREMITAIGDFSPGKELTPLASSYGFGIGVSICFESIFPGIFRKQAELGAHLFANLTNDAWFGRTAAPYQHLSMLVFRAVENRRAIVRAANTGISAFIDPTGNIEVQSRLFEQALLVDWVGPLKVNSFYTPHGDLVVWASVAVLLGLLVAGTARARRRKDVIT